MSKSDCLDANWYRVGKDVGLDGDLDRVTAFNKRADICSKYDVVADLSAFEQGHADGLIEYCEVHNAVKHGVRGAQKALSICSEEDNPGFVAAYDAGYKLYQLRRQETQARYELERLENEEYRTQQRIRNVRSSIDSDSTEEQRRAAQRRIRSLSRNVSNIRYNIDNLRQRYYRAKQAADAYAEFLELEFEEI